ncbi:jg27120, partial [Pararge aegeria aegeria]
CHWYGAPLGHSLQKLSRPPRSPSASGSDAGEPRCQAMLRVVLLLLYIGAVRIADSPVCKACMEADETPTHVLLRCRGVAEQRAAYLGSPASLPEALGDLGGLLSFWSE